MTGPLHRKAITAYESQTNERRAGLRGWGLPRKAHAQCAVRTTNERGFQSRGPPRSSLRQCRTVLAEGCP